MHGMASRRASLQGNLVLTDSKYEILTLLRTHRDDFKGVTIQAKHPYPLQTVRLQEPATAEKLQAALASSDHDKASLKSESKCPAITRDEARNLGAHVLHGL